MKLVRWMKSCAANTEGDCGLRGRRLDLLGRLMGKTRGGDQVLGAALHLQDAPGKKIQSYGHKDVDIVLMTSEGQSVVLKEKVTFSDMVNQPILSFGRLMRGGWSIDGQRQCLRNGSLEVPLAFQNQSLVVEASV